jgi:hypothetical protein
MFSNIGATTFSSHAGGFGVRFGVKFTRGMRELTHYGRGASQISCVKEIPGCEQFVRDSVLECGGPPTLCRREKFEDDL